MSNCVQDFERREAHPDLPWGPSFKQQLEDAVAEGEGEYRELLRDLRLLYKHEKPDSELRILAFVRRDRYSNLFVVYKARIFMGISRYSRSFHYLTFADLIMKMKTCNAEFLMWPF